MRVPILSARAIVERVRTVALRILIWITRSLHAATHVSQGLLPLAKRRSPFLNRNPCARQGFPKVTWWHFMLVMEVQSATLSTGMLVTLMQAETGANHTVANLQASIPVTTTRPSWISRVAPACTLAPLAKSAQTCTPFAHGPGKMAVLGMIPMQWALRMTV